MQQYGPMSAHTATRTKERGYGPYGIPVAKRLAHRARACPQETNPELVTWLTQIKVETRVPDVHASWQQTTSLICGLWKLLLHNLH